MKTLLGTTSLTIHKYKLGHNFNHQGKSIHSNSINGYGDDKNLAKLKRLHQKEYTRNIYDVRITFSEITIIALHMFENQVRFKRS